MTGKPRLLITRPAADAECLGRRVTALGYRACLHPLLDVRPLPAADMPLDGVQALLATSANGVRALAAHPAAGRAHAIPLFAVGPVTAQTARDAGFAEVREAHGDVASLAHLVNEQLKPAAGSLLHLAGRITAGDLAQRLSTAGFETRLCTLYDAVPVTALSPGLCALLNAGEMHGALFYSARTAQVFLNLYKAAGLEPARLTRVTAYCLAPSVAQALEGTGFGNIVTAQHPNEQALLARLDCTR